MNSLLSIIEESKLITVWRRQEGGREEGKEGNIWVGLAHNQSSPVCSLDWLQDLIITKTKYNAGTDNPPAAQITWSVSQ